MERRILQPEQIIVPYEYELGNEAVLSIYFRIFDRGHEDDLPPLIVANPNHSDRDFLLRHFTDEDGFKKYFKTIVEMGNVFYLMDGNHRGVAATLCHKPIKSLELQNDDDLRKLEEMVKTGEYLNSPNFSYLYFEDGDVQTKLSAPVTYLEEQQKSREILTLRQRVDKLALNGDLPQYMIERYHRGK